MLASAVPLTLAWFGMGILAWTGASELLEHTGGLTASTFTAGFWLGWLLNGGFLGWACWRAIRRRLGQTTQSPYTPLIGLASLYGVVGAALVYMDLGPLDVPDAATATFLVGYLLLWTFVAPVFIAAFVLRIAVAAWRSSSQLEGALRVVAGATGIALGSGTLVAMFGGGIAGGYFESTASVLQHDAQGPQASADVDLMHTAAAGFAALISSEPSAPVKASRFSACTETLRTAEGDGRSSLDRAVGYMMRSHATRQDAVELAWDAMIDTCREDARRAKRRIRPYFWSVVKNHRAKAWGLACRIAPPPPGMERICEVNPPDPAAGLAVREAMAKLTPDERQVIVLAHVEGHSSAEIGERLGIRPDAARARLSRAMTALRDAYFRN